MEKMIKNWDSSDSETVLRMFASILDTAGIRREDSEVHWQVMLGVLSRKTTDHIVMTIWKNLSKKQAKHLKEFLAQNAIIEPWKSSTESIIEFANMYPDLSGKIEKSLDEFFKDFVKTYRKIDES